MRSTAGPTRPVMTQGALALGSPLAAAPMMTTHRLNNNL